MPTVKYGSGSLMFWRCFEILVQYLVVPAGKLRLGRR